MDSGVVCHPASVARASENVCPDPSRGLKFRSLVGDKSHAASVRQCEFSARYRVRRDGDAALQGGASGRGSRDPEPGTGGSVPCDIEMEVA